MSTSMSILRARVQLLQELMEPLADFHLLRLERDRLVESNETLLQKNLSLYRQKLRLEKDPVYIEQVAREELGLVSPNDLVIIAPSD